MLFKIHMWMSDNGDDYESWKNGKFRGTIKKI